MSDANDAPSPSSGSTCCRGASPSPPSCGCPLEWLDHRTGIKGAIGGCLGRRVVGGVQWANAIPSAIFFLFVVQATTGFFLWMYYSPSAQSAWESVYYLENEVAGGSLLRGVHHYAAQVLVGLTGVYVVLLLVRRRYLAPRECVFWVAVCMGLASLGLCLTGDLLAWDQNSYASTLVRVRFALLVPIFGDELFKLAAGGPAFGHLTLTRFLALHIGVLGAGFLVLLGLHGWFHHRAELAAENAGEGPERSEGRYWPDQFTRNTVVWLVVMLLVGLLVGQHALWGEHTSAAPGDRLGVVLGAPADPDPANSYEAARPEWSFRALYQFSNIFPGNMKLVPIFLVPGFLVLAFFAMPFIGRLRRGHALNLSFLGLVLLSGVILSAVSWHHDFENADHQANLAEGHAQADRAKELARAPMGIPPNGALSLVRNDPKTRGPVLFEKQCAICHNYSAPTGHEIVTETPSAPELHGFASRAWLAGFLDPAQIQSATYYGNTRFASGAMVRYVEGPLTELGEDARSAIVAALSAEARLESQAEQDIHDADQIGEGRDLIKTHCTRCHRFDGAGELGSGPDLTGYGSREWIMGLLLDPAHPWFYGQRNDRMPAYLEHPEERAKNRLSASEVQLMTDWLRQTWYEPEAENAASQDEARVQSLKETHPMYTVGVWASRRDPQEPIGPTARNPAIELFQREHCAVCHGFTGSQEENLVASDPSAPDLGGFASKEWIAGLLDPKQVAGPKYFGNSAFAEGSMVGYVRGSLKELRDELGQEELDKLIQTLANEAKRGEAGGPDEIADEAKFAFEDFTCTDCHKFHDLGDSGSAPDLTAYGSRQWIVDFLGDPTGERFYGDDNHGMPSYRMFPEEPQKNLLDERQLQLLADLLRGTSSEG